MNADESWIYDGKTIAQLIRDLETFEDKTMKVFISIDCGKTRFPISIVGKKNGDCLIKYCGD